MKLHRGGIYRVNERSGRWDLMAEGYDLDSYQKNYKEQDGVVFRKGDNGTLNRHLFLRYNRSCMTAVEISISMCFWPCWTLLVGADWARS